MNYAKQLNGGGFASSGGVVVGSSSGTSNSPPAPPQQVAVAATTTTSSLSSSAATTYNMVTAASLSDSEPEFIDNSSVELRGYLSKWTNYIYGWQPRYIVLKDGTLSYYKSESESDFGCRGAISLSRATIKVGIINK